MPLQVGHFPGCKLPALGLALLLTACGGSSPAPTPDEPSAGTPESTTTASDYAAGRVRAFDQDGDGSWVMVAEATIEGKAGWILIHVDDGGPEEVIGHAPLPIGRSRNVVVHLDRKVGTVALWAMIHRDEGVRGTFEWPGPDGPVRPFTGGIAYAKRKFLLTVP